MVPMASITAFAILAVEEVAMHIEQPVRPAPCTLHPALGQYPLRRCPKLASCTLLLASPPRLTSSPHIAQFGSDDDDLPIEAYCLSLEADLLAMLDDENL